MIIIKNGEDDDDADDNEEHERKMMMLMLRRKMMMLRRRMWRRKTDPKMGRTLCASLRSRNAHGHFTRAILRKFTGHWLDTDETTSIKHPLTVKLLP